MNDEHLSAGCDPADCASCAGGCGDGAAKITPHPTITLTLDDDKQLECAVLTTFEGDGREYISLLPLDENGKNTSGEVYLFRYAEENDQPVIENIQNQEEYDMAAKTFNSFMEELEQKRLEKEPQ